MIRCSAALRLVLIAWQRNCAPQAPRLAPVQQLQNNYAR